MADVFEDRPDLVVPRARLAMLVLRTPWLDWLLLTKRPENAVRLWTTACGGGLLPAGASIWPANIWVGTTVEDQRRADERIPHLLRIPARVRFLSCEPLLEALDLRPWMRWVFARGVAPNPDGTPFALPARGGDRGVDWVIVGGESGRKARPFDLAWARDIVKQCKDSGVPVFVKQLGATPVVEVSPAEAVKQRLPAGARVHVPLRDSHGGDPAEWPEDLRVRELPTVAA